MRAWAVHVGQLCRARPRDLCGSQCHSLPFLAPGMSLVGSIMEPWLLLLLAGRALWSQLLLLQRLRLAGITLRSLLLPLQLGGHDGGRGDSSSGSHRGGGEGTYA